MVVVVVNVLGARKFVPGGGSWGSEVASVSFVNNGLGSWGFGVGDGDVDEDDGMMRGRGGAGACCFPPLAVECRNLHVGCGTD